MACTAFDAMAVLSKNLANDVHRAATHNSLWLNAVPRATYATNTGLTQQTFNIENSQPLDDTETWSAITLSDSSSSGNIGACADPTWTDATLGYTAKEYNPSRFALRGPVLCSTDLIFQHAPDAFLSAYVDELGKRSKKSWENQLINKYMEIAHKAIVTGTGATAGITTDAAGSVLESTALAATTVNLEQAHLDTIAIELIENGATEGDSNGFITLEAEGPVFPLVCSMEASNQLAKNNSDLRADLRYGEPNQLLKRLGASRVLGSFRHVPQITMPRFAHDGTNYTRVHQYVAKTGSDAATKGTGYELNPSWKTADYEAAIILNPSVMRTEVVPPVSSAGGVNFDPVSYNGDWQWVLGGNNICDNASAGADPLKKLGRHYAEYMAAFAPVRPEDGMTVIFKRTA